MTTLDDFPETAMEPSSPAPQREAARQLDRMEPLNLARRPFLNSRPVVRVSLILWLLGLALVFANASLFWGYLTSSADKRQQLARGRSEIERQQRIAQQLQARLRGIDLASLNERVDFLNEKIEHRTFSWSLLFDRLAEVLPDDVRLNRLAPQTGERAQRLRLRLRLRQGSDRSRQFPEGSVQLTMTGESRNDEALFQLVDNMFKHPAFRDPNPTREEKEQDGNLLRFELTVLYLPGGQPRAAIGEIPTIEEVPPATGAAGRTSAPRAPVPGGRP